MNARVRAVHASPDAPSVDVGVATMAGLSPVVFSQLSFGNASAAGAMERIEHRAEIRGVR